MQRELTNEEITHFREHGWLLARRLINPELARQLAPEGERILRESKYKPAGYASDAFKIHHDGGFELTRGRGSDAQSTAWAIQGLVAAGARPPRSAFAYLAKLRRPDGSYRYSARFAATPVWVTSQVLAALAKKPFPL